MEEKVNPEAKEGIIGPSEAEIQEIDRLAEEGKLEPEEGLVPIPRGLKTAIWVAAGLGTASCTGPLMGLAERLAHPPAEAVAREEPSVEASQVQAEAPKIVVLPEAEGASKYFERASPTQDFLVQIQASEPVVLPEESPPKVEDVIYEVQPDDALISIAEGHGLFWQALYGKNIAEIGYNPNNLQAGKKLFIPDATRDKELIEKLDPRRITDERFPSIDLLANQDPEKLRELRWRAVAVVAYDLNGRQIFFDDWREFRDFRIFDYHGKQKELNYTSVLETLAWYELEFERNPVIERVLQEMTPGIRVMNEILMDKASPEWFKDEKISQLPEDLSDRFTFTGGGERGLGYPYYPLVNSTLLGSLDSYKEVKQRLPLTGFHELTHSIIQFESVIKPPPWIEQSEEEDRFGLLRPENKSSHLGHKAMDILTISAMEAIGYPPTPIDSRILYIYWVLKRESVSDPYVEILRAAVTMNGDRLWQIYEEARLPSDLSMGDLFVYQERGTKEYYSALDQWNEEKVLEELRAEYLPYLSR